MLQLAPDTITTSRGNPRTYPAGQGIPAMIGHPTIQFTDQGPQSVMEIYVNPNLDIQKGDYVQIVSRNGHTVLKQSVQERISAVDDPGFPNNSDDTLAGDDISVTVLTIIGGILP